MIDKKNSTHFLGNAVPISPKWMARSDDLDEWNTYFSIDKYRYIYAKNERFISLFDIHKWIDVNISIFLDFIGFFALSDRSRIDSSIQNKILLDQINLWQ